MLYSGWVPSKRGRWYQGRSIFVDELESRLKAAGLSAA